MTEPQTPIPTDSQRTSPGLPSRAALVAVQILKEIGWVLWQVSVWFFRGIISFWSLAKQRQLNLTRRTLLLQLGTEIRQGAIPASDQAFESECDRLDGEVRRHKYAAETATGWWGRTRSKISLRKADAERGKALRMLGESGIANASLETRTALANIEASIASEQIRRSQLWQPWRTLSLRRRAEIIGVIIALLATGGIFFHHRLPIDGQAPTDNQSQAELAPEDAPAHLKDQRQLAAEFAENRKAATSGEWLVYGGNPVLERGELENWDDFKVGNEIVLSDGAHFQMWYRACHFVLRQYACGVGHATSEDGVIWEKSKDAVFLPDNNHERERLDSLAIIRGADQYWMWYSVRPDRFNGFPYATVHVATSKDGMRWIAGGPVLRALSQYTGNLEPSAYWDGKLFHMWYTDHPTDENEVMLHLTSTDGKSWQTAGSTPLSILKTNPGRLSVTSDSHGGYRAYFASAGQDRSAGVFGVLLSNDGNEWRRAESEPKLSFQEIGSGSGFAMAPSVIAAADGLWVWYTFRPNDGAEAISMAFLKEKLP